MPAKKLMKTEHHIHQISNEMEKIFIARAKLHRLLVKKNLLMMQGYLDLSPEVLIKRAQSHDLSKYKTSERLAYTWMTWMYYCKNHGIAFEYPTGVEKIVQQGWQHHITHNAHHPEAHDDPNNMSNLDIVEMVCDWTAISQENDSDNASCFSWASANIDKKWNFSAAQKNFIFATIHELDRRNQERRTI
jgi:hypothetical protein